MTRKFVVSGLHRSGTTFVGEILKHAGINVVHEPLNERFGMGYVPIAYPYCEKTHDEYSELIDDMVHFRRPWNKNSDFIQARGIRRLIYQVSGGRSGLRWGWLRLRKKFGLPKQNICLKDPFACLSTPYLVRKYGIRTICMVRHPSAIHYSTMKQGWWFDVDNLQRQKGLIESYGRDIPETHWELARNSPAASIAILWKLMMRINSRAADSDERLLMITHETLCLEPIETATKICKHFGIAFTPIIKQYVVEHSFGERAEAQNGKTHDFKRDSRAIPDSWRGKLTSSDEEMIYQIAGKEVQQYYGAW